MKYNFRDSSGRFAKQNFHRTLLQIVPGRLYGYKGGTVRAHYLFGKNSAEPKWLVSFHKTLFGLVKPSELMWIDAEQVMEYLDHARCEFGV